MIPYKIIELITGAVLFLCMLQDIKTGKVSLLILGTGGALLLLLLPFCSNFRLWDGINGVWPGLILIGISRVTNGKLGFGDGLVYCITGLGLGFYRNLWLLCISLFLTALLFSALWIEKKAGRNSALPFTPFIFAAYLGLTFLW